MNELIVILYLCLFAVSSVLVIVYLAKVHSFFDYLKDNDPKTWENLGRPHLFFNNTPVTGIRFIRFLYKKEYLALADSVAREKAITVKALLTAGFVGIVILFGVFAIIFVGVFPKGS